MLGNISYHGEFFSFLETTIIPLAIGAWRINPEIGNFGSDARSIDGPLPID
jgi:hypothetical protein